MMNRFFMFFLLIGLVSCGADSETNEVDTDLDTNSVNSQLEEEDIAAITESSDSILVPSFSIQLELSEKAEAKLKADKESIIVQAYFSGTPKDTTSQDYLEWGETAIGEKEIELWDTRIAHFENVKIEKAAFDKLSDPNYQVLINVFSGRHSSENNLLSAGIVQDGIEQLKGTTASIKCTLIVGE